MANYELGELLRAARAYTGLSQEELAWEVCSTVALSFIETGKTMPSPPLIEKLMEKLGRRGFPYTAFLAYSKVQRYYIWKRIQDAATREDIEQLKICIQQGKAKKESDIIYNQYLLYAEAFVESYQNNNSEIGLQKYLDAISMTIPNFSTSYFEQENKRLLTYEEIIIMYHLAIQYRDCCKYIEAYNILYGLKEYVEVASIDVEQRKSIYPKILEELVGLLVYCNKNNILINHKNVNIYKEMYFYCEEGVTYCIENGLLYSMMDLILCEIDVLSLMNRKEEKEKKEIELQCLNEIVKVYGGDIRIKESRENEVESGLYNYSIGELIKMLRKESNITMKDLCKGICSCSTLSRIENGEQLPKEDVIRAILERLGKNGIPYVSLISQKKMEWYNLEMIVRNKIAWKDWDNLEYYVSKLEKSIPQNNKLAKQYLLFAKALVKEMIYGEKASSVLQMLLKAIRLTIPNYEINIYKYNFLFTNNEIAIICSIARQIYKMGDRMEAIHINYLLKNNIERKEDEDKGRFYPVILVNLSKWLGMSGLYKESNEICYAGLKYCVIYGKLALLPYFIVNMGSNYANQKLPVKAKRYYQYAYYIYRAMKKTDMMEYVQQAASEEYGILLMD